MSGHGRWVHGHEQGSLNAPTLKATFNANHRLDDWLEIDWIKMKITVHAV